MLNWKSLHRTAAKTWRGGGLQENLILAAVLMVKNGHSFLLGFIWRACSISQQVCALMSTTAWTMDMD